MTQFFAKSSAPVRRRVLVGALLAALWGGATGCYFEGGPMASADRFTYVSSSWQPKTISLIDTRTGETIWSVDVPVGKKLVIDFNPPPKDETGADPARPDVMVWDLMAPDQYFGQLKNKVRVPGPATRRVEMTLRPAPELPEEMATAREGQPQAQ
jgi:hypothetical protein